MPIRDRTYSLPTASLHVGLAAEDHHIKKIHLSGLDEEMTDYKLCAIGKKNVGKSGKNIYWKSLLTLFYMLYNDGIVLKIINT